MLKIAEREDPGVNLHALKVDIKITGSVSTTTLHMTFKNSYARILEGELTIPLPEGASVSRYALDINGRMREAVPVDKAKGTQVFEAIERRRVDPGLLEKVEGNNFRTRIYPIPANGTRQIIIAYEQELTLNKKNELRYHLPLQYKKPIPEFSLQANVVKSNVEPLVESAPGELVFEEWNHNFSASIEKKDFKPKESLSFLLPKKESALELMMQQSENGYYFLINLYRKASVIAKEKPGTVSLIWDVSLSGIHRDIKKELELMDEYFKQNKELTVNLVAFNNYSRLVRQYKIEKGNWEAIRKDIAGFVYDGGTNYSTILFPPSDEYLLFTDGLTALNNGELRLPAKPVYTISSSPKSDFSQLKFIAQKTGASFVNLNSVTASDGIKLITELPLQIIGYKNTENVEEVYPSVPTPIVNSASVAGYTTTKNSSFTVLLGYGNKVIEEKIIQLDASSLTSNTINLEKLWAQKKIGELDVNYDKNKTEIERLGKTYGIVTRNTSLIVLETVQDYVLYEIEPPEELRVDFDRIMKSRSQLTKTRESTINNNAVYYFNQLKNWYGVTIDENDKSVLSPVQQNDWASGAPGSTSIQAPRSDTLIRGLTSIQSNLNEVVVVGYGSSRKKNMTASVSTVTNKSLGFGLTADNALAGKVSGVMVNSANANQLNKEAFVRIRGVGSFTGNEPQYIIDGRPASWREVQLLNISDIESIEIQKGGYYIPSGKSWGHTYFNRKDPSQPKINWRKIKYISDTARAIFKQKDFTIREPYIAILEATTAAERYEKYLLIRNDFLHSPAFYFNVAAWFLENDDYETGITILQNLGEMELQDHELYKMLGYKLKEMGEYELSLAAFRKVLDWRPMEPQSYRDYGLALQDAGLFQQALDTLCLALTKNYAADVEGLYKGIEEMIVTEINQILRKHKKLHLPGSFDKSLVYQMPVDLRVVANWNMNDTDLDLWVIDPVGEKCYYGHRNTQIGGRLSNDFTRGYGPEQFLLKKAIKGKYKLQVNFFGQSAVKIIGSTTIQVEVFIHYGSESQQRQVVTLQTTDKQNRLMMVGEFEFK